MKRHAKAASAGSTSSRGNGLGSIRRAFATRGALGDADGSGAPSARSRAHRALFVVAGALLLALLIAPAAFANGELKVTVASSGSGTVTSTSEQIAFGSPFGSAPASPGEINCNKAGGPICNSRYTNVFAEFGSTEVKVTLTATPDPGGGPFIGWVQGDGTPSNRCTVPPAANPTCEIILTGFTPGPTAAVYAVFGSPLEAPLASTDGNSAGPGETAILEGRVNPNGIAPFDCHFAYGPTAAYGKSAPCDQSPPSLGGGTSDKTVTATTEPLEPDTTYHFRLLTESPGGKGQGKDRTFTTAPAPTENCPNADIRASQGIEVLHLPECMALEQVSPSTKGNQSARLPSAISEDGNRLIFNSVATLGNCPNVNGLGGDSFIAMRNQHSGWATECSTPPVSKDLGTREPPKSYTPDFSRWFQLIITSAGGSNGPQFLQEELGGPTTPLSPPLVNLNGSGGPQFLGASEDHSHLYLTPQGSRTGTFLPGDPQPTDGGLTGSTSSEDSNLYVTHLDSEGHPTLELFARDRDGKVWGANCGARLGGMESITGINLNLPNGPRNQGAISPDGSRVYFSTRPSQPPTGDCTGASKKRIMVREETPTGPKVEELISSECDRVSPPCATYDDDDSYQGASVDQTRVYFTTNRQLADSDLDGSSTTPCVLGINKTEPAAQPGCDLYLYDATRPAGDRLTQVSAGEDNAPTPGEGATVFNGIAGISADGSHVYFVAKGVLTTDPNPEGAVAQPEQRNLYLYTYPQGDTSFIGTLDSVDGCAVCGGSGALPVPYLFGGGATWQNDAYPVPIRGTDAQGNEVGGDGHILVFRSHAALTPDDTDSARDIFRYDADAGTLERVSRAGSGGSDNGPFDAIKRFSGSEGTDYGQQGRWVSEDGESIAFTTAEPLFAGDTNGAEDSYLWHAGQVFHLPGSGRSSASARQILPILSADGAMVAYHSTKQLVPSDGDSTEDVYVARVDGGFRTSIRPVCQGEACQGAPSTLSDEIGATTGSLRSAGNLKAQGTQARGCPKGKHKVRRGGKSRCVKPAKHKKQASHQKKRAGAKQGGQK